MFAKALIVVALAAYANAGAVTYLANPSVGAQSEQTVRGLGGLSSASHYSKAVDSAFSSVRKFDSRVTNDAYAVRAAPVAYAAPAYAAPAYAAPAYAAQAYAAPLSYAAPVARVAAPVAYAAPVARVAAAPVAYATPALAPRAIAAPHGLLGVAYSPVSPAVATLTFDGFGIHYGY